MKVDRDPNRPVKHLEWRVRLLGVGAVLALAGMMMERGWMVNVAIGVLLVGFTLRYLPDRGEPEPDGDTAPGEEDAWKDAADETRP